MFEGVLIFIESKRKSDNVFWKILIQIKDFIFYKFFYRLTKKISKYGVVCDSKKFIFVYVMKNASTSLRMLAFESDQISWEKGERKKKISFKESQKDKYKDYIKFAVYRDPVERFLSIYKNKILSGERDFKEEYKKNNIKDVELKTFINFAKKEIKNKSGCNPHLLPQSLLYKKSDVDYIVPIEKLEIFIKDKFKCGFNIKANCTENIISTLKNEDIEEIKKIYSEDYKIKPNY